MVRGSGAAMVWVLPDQIDWSGLDPRMVKTMKFTYALKQANRTPYQRS